MKLVTKKIEERFKKFPLYSQDGKGKQALCLAKFFLCLGAWTWYILEANVDEGIAYGIVISQNGEGEYSYINLSELQGLRTRMGLTVERDLFFEPERISLIDDPYLQKFLKKMYDK